jgi:hypothetical protein
MLPILAPNLTLAATLNRLAAERGSLAIRHLASLVRRTAYHYAVDTHRFPQFAAYDAALCIAATVANNSRYSA